MLIQKNHRAAEEFIRYIAQSIRGKLALLLCSANTFSVLNDGPEARKTGMEQETLSLDPRNYLK